MRILFCAHRDWAISTCHDIEKLLTYDSHHIAYVTTPEDLETLTKKPFWDVIILVGWSWKVSSDVVMSTLVIGMHPSDLPHYAGGSPIQNQILDGVVHTKATLFKLNEKFDNGEIIDKEPIDLSGHLSDVLESISCATKRMIIDFVRKCPDNVYVQQPHIDQLPRKRLKPSDSKFSNPTKNAVDHTYVMTCKEMWDNIRCREDPYPNVYFEDETGTLIIKRAEFIPK